jgi:hypothetical protein
MKLMPICCMTPGEINQDALREIGLLITNGILGGTIYQWHCLLPISVMVDLCRYKHLT